MKSKSGMWCYIPSKGEIHPYVEGDTIIFSEYAIFYEKDLVAILKESAPYDVLENYDTSNVTHELRPKQEKV